MIIEDLVKQITSLQAQIDKLKKPEVPITGAMSPTKVKNTSGITTTVGMVGYLTLTAGAGMEFKTTTTANDNRIGGIACVIVGGINNADIYTVDFGRHTIPYAGTAPAAGDYLVFSTTAGSVAKQTYMSPDVLAIAMAAGSGGVVDAQLLARSTFVPYSSANHVLRIDNHSATAFVSVINGAPSATSVVYGAVTGNEDSIVPVATTQLGKIVLNNTTRSTSRLITANNTGTNTITTVSSADAWATTDAIQANSATCNSGGSPFFFDIDLSQQSEIPTLARAIAMTLYHSDSGGNSFIAVHPFETFSNPKQKIGFNYSTAVGSYTEVILGLISRKFCFRASSAGAGSTISQIIVDGYWMASP